MQKQDQTFSNAFAVIVAGGSGVRAGLQQGRPKQYCQIGGRPVLTRTIEAFCNHPRVRGVVVVIREGDEDFYKNCVTDVASSKLIGSVNGGMTRQLSVYEGLKALKPHNPDVVLIHDAARPFINSETISATLTALNFSDGAIAASPVTDTLKQEYNGHIAKTVARDGLWRAQTPQTFRYDKIMKAHSAATEASHTEFTDDASIAEWYGLNVALVENASENMKITTSEDLHLADMIAGGSGTNAPDVRTGSGFDVHAFEEGDYVTLCGVRIPHTKGLKAHSDGDVGLHALTDALLGTIGAGDIGDHFPPSDPQWRAADSAIFLLHAAMLVREHKGVITNADITLVCERPKIGPYRDSMRARIAELLNIDLKRVSLKATTSEGMGFTGRSEGIAGFATATVVFKGS